MKAFTLSLLFAFSASLVLAGGSESFTDHLLPIIKNEKAFTKLQSEYVFDEAIWANVRMGSHTNFGGLRLGPYIVRARNKNETEWSTKFTFETTYTFFDKDGNEVHFLSQEATSHTERLTKINETITSRTTQ